MGKSRREDDRTIDRRSQRQNRSQLTNTPTFHYQLFLVETSCSKHCLTANETVLHKRGKMAGTNVDRAGDTCGRNFEGPPRMARYNGNDCLTTWRLLGNYYRGPAPSGHRAKKPERGERQLFGPASPNIPQTANPA